VDRTILTLDVGFRATGWAVCGPDGPVACGVIRTEPSAKKLKVRTADDYSIRAAKMARELHNIIRAYNVARVIGELPSGGAQNARAMAMMNMATAVVAAVVELNELPSEWATPGDVKLALCGKKSASKDDMMNKARAVWGHQCEFPAVKAEFEHIADACGAWSALKYGSIVRAVLLGQRAGKIASASK
jgi:Holliday junction resolvasome RuvABC endonuclease subunit